MQCFDCALEAQISPAVAVCSTCGAGLCGDHAMMGHATQTTVTTVGNPTEQRLPGRRLLCRACVTDGLFDATPMGSRVAAAVN